MIQPKMKSNTAAYQPAVGEKLHIKEASYPSPSENQIVVQNRAIGINPVDWKVQDVQLFPTFKYPTVLGSDVAGIVAEIGSGVTRFKRGDAVVGHAVGMMSQTPAASAFQEYTVLQENLVARLPSFLTYERAAILPTGVSTAACGLFQKDHLALELPSANPKSTGKTLLVWGGSSNVGSNSIQLAVAAGYEVITTASPKNHAYVKSLGASQALDYNSKDIIDDLATALKEKTIAGAIDTVGATSQCLAVLSQIPGSKHLSTTVPPPADLKVPDVKVNQIRGTSLKDNEVGKAIWVDFLGKALAEERYTVAPEPWVVGRGLESLQTGLDECKKGVSAKKVVIGL